MEDNDNIIPFEEAMKKRKWKEAKEGFFRVLGKADEAALLYPQNKTTYAFGSFNEDDFPLSIISAPEPKEEEKTGAPYKEYIVKVYENVSFKTQI